ncbi:MAG: glycosyltransferase family 4 protein [Sarcina sp.]
MKIVFLAKFFDLAGTTTHMLTLGRGVIKDGHEVMLLCGKPKNYKEKELMNKFIEAGFDVKLLDFLSIEAPSRKYVFIELFKYLKELPKGIKYMKAFNPDLIHVHWPVTQYLAKLYKILYNTPYVTTLHIKNTKKTFLHQKPDAMIAISREILDDTFNIYNMKRDNVYTIFNGVDEREFCNNTTEDERIFLKKELEIDNNYINILQVGSICKRKGIDILIKACSKLNESGIKFNLILLGSGDTEWLNGLIKEHKIKNIKVYPFQDTKKFYDISDICVLASRKEGFGLVVIEAMLNKKPVIRTNTEGAVDQINHLESGIIFEQDNYEELYYYLKKLILDKNLREEISENGFNFAKSNFTSEIMAQNTIKAYRKILKI